MRIEREWQVDRAVDPLPGEAFLLAGLRSWAVGRLAGQCAHRAARFVAWRSSPRVAALFVGWMLEVEDGVRRPLDIRCRHAVTPSEDERHLIHALGLAPVDMEAGETLLAALCANPGGVMALARPLNAALSAAGLAVPARLGDDLLHLRDAAASLH